MQDVCSLSTTVTDQNTAVSMGSGSLPVFATPAMCALMEKASAALLQQQLGADDTSVGTALNISHTSATPLGLTVTATATLLAFDGKLATFKVVAHDDYGPIGQGTHTRAVVGANRFLERTVLKKPVK